MFNCQILQMKKKGKSFFDQKSATVEEKNEIKSMLENG